MAALIEQAKAAGAFVASGGMHPAESAKVVQRRRGATLVTDGPFVEGKEHLGGFLIVQAADLDGALEWAGRLAGVLTIEGPNAPESGLPLEVRAFEHLVVER
jgi:hypothetical protein